MTDAELATIVRSGTVPEERLAHVFALFTDVPVPWLLDFARDHGISLDELAHFYQQHVRPYYRNEPFEELFRY